MITDKQRTEAEAAAIERDVERWGAIVAELSTDIPLARREILRAELLDIRNHHHGPPGNLVELETVTTLRLMEAEQARVEAGVEKGTR